jgi:hypothetical protein
MCPREPSSKADLARRGVQPSCEAGLTRGGRSALERGGPPPRGQLGQLFRWAVGATGVAIMLRVFWARGFVCICVFYEIRWVFPDFLGDPYGCPRHRRRTDLFHGAPRKTHRGNALGRLLFVTVEHHSLGGGGRQHRGRRTGTWPRGLLLAEPPLESRAIPATETRKAEAREGDRRQEEGGAFIKKVQMCK